MLITVDVCCCVVSVVGVVVYSMIVAVATGDGVFGVVVMVYICDIHDVGTYLYMGWGGNHQQYINTS